MKINSLILLGTGIILSFQSMTIADPLEIPGEHHIYKTVNNQNLSLWILSPGSSPDDLKPAIILFHGGGWTAGSPTELAPIARIMSEAGAICVLVEYRLVGKSANSVRDCIYDAKTAIRWVRQHATSLGIDPVQIVAAGASAGAHIAAAAGTRIDINEPGDDSAISARPDALILFGPPLELGSEAGAWLDGPPGYRLKLGLGEPVGSELSPLQHITPDTPPTLLLLGEDDPYIPVSQLRQFRKSAAKWGIRCWLAVLPNQPHEIYLPTSGEGFHSTMAITKAFLAELKILDSHSHKHLNTASILLEKSLP